MNQSAVKTVALLAALTFTAACGSPESASPPVPEPEPTLTPEYTLAAENTHNRWSATIPPVLTVPSGAVVEIFTKEASDGQITPETTAEDLRQVDFGLIHALTGPIAVEGAEPGDLLAVTIHEADVQGPGWAGIFPGFGFLADEFTEPWIRSFDMGPGASEARFNDRITIPLSPFPGVLGVAPATDEMLVTIPPRENGGNMDNRHMRAGTTVYIPVQVPGANFSIGDTHAVQADGEVSGTAIEVPMRLVVHPRGDAESAGNHRARVRDGGVLRGHRIRSFHRRSGEEGDPPHDRLPGCRARADARRGLRAVLTRRGSQDLGNRGRSQHAGQHAHAEVDLLSSGDV